MNSSIAKLAVNHIQYPVRAVIAAALLAIAGCSTPPPPPPKMPVAQAKPPQPAPPAPKLAAVPSGMHIRVALLLPLTGTNAQLGQAMLDAANLAVYDQADKTFELLPVDTGDTPDKAKQAADQAIAGGAKLILGPIFANAVASAAPEAANAHVPIISFTTDATQAQGNVFVMGFLPSLEVRRVIGYAKAKGVQSFSVLAPDSPYGNLIIAAVQAAVPGVNVVRYPAGTTDFTASAQQAKLGSPNGGMPGAILLPEGGAELRAIARSLAAAGVNPVQIHLLGTGLWDDPTLAQEPELNGGWYAGTAPAARADFEKRFLDVYKYKPQRLSTLAYDATALAIVLGRQAQPGKDPFDRGAITKESGFAGLDGVFRFGLSGQIERALAVLQVSPAGPAVIDPAPRAFSTLAGGDGE